MAIRCCAHCVPPKRHSGCHSTCPEYIKEKAKHEEENRIRRQAKLEEGRIVSQQIKSVQKALKHRRTK